jgi:hypothetical protein
MNILIDIGHPAHVHLFKNFVREMTYRGHKVLFTCRDKEFEIYLLDFYGFEYKSFGKKYKSTAGKLLGMIKFDIKEFLTGLKFKPDLLLSHGSIYAAHASFLLRKPHISFEDTFNFEQIKLYKPFTETILTGTYEHPLKGKQVLKYIGYHELAYLHPKHFSPDKNILEKLGVEKNEKYSVIRFVSWGASHDKGLKGIPLAKKIELIESLLAFGKVFISSENPLPEKLIPYKLLIPPECIHSALYYSSLMFGESGTMAAEASILGVPSIFIDKNSRLYTQEIESKYGLCFCFDETEKSIDLSIQKAKELINSNKSFNASKRDSLIADNIDVTTFLIWFTENYPQSKKIMQNDPEYQLRFK